METRQNDLPEPVREAATLHLVDMLGCAIAGADDGISRAAASVLRSQGGTAEATALGCGHRLPAPSAAMVNGTAAHALDFDDTHEQSICHVSAVVGPAALAAAEATGCSGPELLTAYVLGSETACRVGMGAPAGFHARGFHPTSVCGVIGATVAAARLYGLDTERTTSAIGLAGSLASGIFAYLDDGTPTKPIHAGWAAQAGVQAALLSAAGAEGPPSVLDSRYGLYEAFAGRPADADELLGELGIRWELRNIAFKAYPACHFLHSCIDATVEALAAAGGAGYADIEHVAVRIPRAGVGLVLEPAVLKPRPRTPYEAKFSLPYSVASRLVHGALDLTSYTPDTLVDPVVSALADRFTHTAWTEEDLPAPFAGEATVVLQDSRSAHRRIDWPLGSPHNPMSHEQVLAKFRTNAGLALEADAVETLLEATLALDVGGPVGEVSGPLSRTSAASPSLRRRAPETAS